jgi:hypothetical protein
MMKNVFLVLVAAATLTSTGLFAVCGNNIPGLMHKKSYKGRYAYVCNHKSAEAYGRSANKFYTGGTCNYCGCPSEEHKRVAN